MIRCNWANNNLLLSNYHDNEWGIPLYDDQLLFESLTLELFQSGLSWLTILQKRDHFRKAFDYFNIDSISNYDQIDVDRLLSNSNVVRHRLKIETFDVSPHTIAYICTRHTTMRYHTIVRTHNKTRIMKLTTRRKNHREVIEAVVASNR